MMTEATPRHNDRTPSVVETDRRCWVMVLKGGAVGRGRVALPAAEVEPDEAEARTAEGVSDGRTCIRVLIESMGKTTECSEIPAWR
jgi:hypothetical protein